MPGTLARLLALALVLVPARGSAQWKDSALTPFVMDHRAATSSPADVSFLLEAPAGKHGFVGIRNGHLAKGNGARLRLWGVHLTDWSRGSVLLPPKGDIPMWASTLARFGVNCVRLHFLDLDAPRGIIAAGTDSRHFDPDQLDRLDFLVSELKRRGIYVDLNLNVGRSYKANDPVTDPEKIGWAKGLVLYDPRLIALEREYARAILTHRNPYTGLAYRDDPAVAIVEILNENALWVGFRAPTPYYDELLTRQYNAWLPTRYSPQQIARLRALTGVADSAPVPRLNGPEVGGAPRERFVAEVAFIQYAESAFYNGMARYLRDSLGVKVPITGTADHGHSSSPYPMLASLATLDVMDGHVYWQHPGSPPPVNTPMVNDPLHSTVAQLARTAVAGKPYTVSEFNHPFPNDWASEGIPILAAYAGLQDWDAIIVYTFEPKRDAAWAPYIGDPFDISLDPVRMTQMAAGALMFLRGDVSRARQTLARSYSADQVIDSRRLMNTEAPWFTPGYSSAAPLMHATRIASFAGAPTMAFPAPEGSPILSDTRELSWFRGQNPGGVVTINTPRTQGVVGFVGAPHNTLQNLAVHVDNTFASVVLTPLDSQPVARSRRMLLSATSRVTNTGFQSNADHSRVTEQGHSPTLIEPVTGHIVLSHLTGATAVSAVALDGAGRPTGDTLKAERRGAEWQLRIGTPATTWYVVTVAH